jgi:hypothetical protein
VPEHVRMRLEIEASCLASPLHKLCKAGGGERRRSLADEQERPWRAFPMQPGCSRRRARISSLRIG